jgi:hypothetical protein
VILAGGEVRLVIREASLLRVFAVTGTDRMFPSFASLPEALAPGPQGALASFRPRQASGVVRGSARPAALGHQGQLRRLGQHDHAITE